MYKTTLVNLSPDASHAAPDLGRHSLGEITKPAVVLLLARFLALDPLENFEADPEIIFESRRRKRLVRRNAGKLCLYDPSNTLAVALVLNPEEIVAELDNASTGNVAMTMTDIFAHRSSAPRPLAPKPTLIAVMRPAQRVGLGTLALALMGFLVFAWWPNPSPQPVEPFIPLVEDQSYASRLIHLAGVYMTGNRPGDHGVVIEANGTLKLFQLNGVHAPSLIRDTIRLGRIDGRLVGLTSQPGGALDLTSQNSLTYCSEVYQRIP